LCKTN